MKSGQPWTPQAAPNFRDRQTDTQTDRYTLTGCSSTEVENKINKTWVLKYHFLSFRLTKLPYPRARNLSKELAWVWIMHKISSKKNLLSGYVWIKFLSSYNDFLMTLLYNLQWKALIQKSCSEQAKTFRIESKSFNLTSKWTFQLPTWSPRHATWSREGEDNRYDE